MFCIKAALNGKSDRICERSTGSPYASQVRHTPYVIRLSAVPLELLYGGYGRDEDLAAGG